VAAVLDLVGDVAAFLDGAEDEAAVMAIRHARSTGRPVGARDWIAALEASTSRQLAAAKRGPKPRSDDKGEPADLFHTVSP
jgi:hypothetical protein